jgi:hypothetical protein
MMLIFRDYYIFQTCSLSFRSLMRLHTHTHTHTRAHTHTHTHTHTHIMFVPKQRGKNTALIFAAERGHVDCVRLLLEVGVNKEAKNRVRCLIIQFCEKCVLIIFIRIYFMLLFCNHSFFATMFLE